MIGNERTDTCDPHVQTPRPYLLGHRRWNSEELFLKIDEHVQHAKLVTFIIFGEDNACESFVSMSGPFALWRCFVDLLQVRWGVRFCSDPPTSKYLLSVNGDWQSSTFTIFSYYHLVANFKHKLRFFKCSQCWVFRISVRSSTAF